MGNTTASGSNLSPSVAQFLSKQTRFCVKDVHKLHRCFRNVSRGKSKLKKECFLGLFQEKYPDANSVQFAEHAFRLYDKDNNGSVDFSEFVLLLNTHFRGEKVERLQLLFRLYDLEQNQQISLDEALRVIHDLHSLNAGLVPKEDVASADIIVNSVFNKFPGDIMETQQFYQFAVENNTMRRLLEGSHLALYKPLVPEEFEKLYASVRRRSLK